jgi:phosphate transport system substrate-binding protein
MGHGLLRTGTLIALVAAFVLSACSRSSPQIRSLRGAGATLPFPLYDRWAREYAAVESSVRVDYQPLGSGAGIRAMSDGVLDFGATDEPMTDAQLREASVPIVHLPMTIGAVVLAFCIPGVSQLQLDAEVTADIFRGALTRWDDPKLQRINPGVRLPAEGIRLAVRADASGTSAAFTAFLSRESPLWRAEMGAGIVPNFPVGVGVRGNDAVSAFVRTTPYSMGYVELSYARQAKLSMALVRNRAGRYIAPSVTTLEHATRTPLSRTPEDLRVSLVDSEDEDAYPIAALSFIVFPRAVNDRKKAEALARFLGWAIHEGQRFAAELDYAPLPKELVDRGERALRGLVEGKGS